MHLRCLFSIVIGYSILALSNIAIAAETSALVSIIGESFHVEFAGQSNWLYQLDRQNGGSSKVELLLPNLDSDSVKKLKDWKGPYVNSVEVQPNNLDGKTRIQFSLEDEGIEFFDYITDQPSRLVVDFFRTKPKPTPKPSQRTSLQADSNKNSKQGTNQKANLDATKAVDPQKISRKPSSDFIAVPVEEKKQEIQSGIFDGGEPDFKRFKIQDYEVREEAIIESRRNVYIPFPMRRIDGSYFNDLTSEKPVYEIIPKETEENKQARLLLTLYNKKRSRACLFSSVSLGIIS